MSNEWLELFGLDSIWDDLPCDSFFPAYYHKEILEEDTYIDRESFGLQSQIKNRR